MGETSLKEETKEEYKQHCLNGAVISNCFAIPHKNVYKNVKNYYRFIDMDIFEHSFENLKNKGIKEKITYILWKIKWKYGLYLFYKSLIIMKNIRAKYKKHNKKEEFRKIA